MKNQREHWNEHYLTKHSELTEYKYDPWLEKYFILLHGKKVLDLGSGIGNDSKILVDEGIHVHACDFSKEALDILSRNLPMVNTTCMDMKEGFPFIESSFQVVISDLSLHYFTWDDTLHIINEISRILDKKGILLLRVNSINDIAYGAGQGIELEKHLYLVKDRVKRFFTEDELLLLFDNWDITHMEEYTNDRFKRGKKLWELCCVKKEKVNG